MKQAKAIFFVSILFTFSVCAQTNEFHLSQSGIGSWDCNVAIEQLESNSHKSSNINSWVAGYFDGAGVRFFKGKSPASTSEYQSVLLPMLNEFCSANTGGNFAQAVDYYLQHKFQKGEAAIGN